MIELDRLLPEELTVSAVISLIFHPLLIPAPSGVLILSMDGLSVSSAVYWIGICAAITVLPLSVYIFVMKAIWGRETSVRRNRHQLYVLGVGLTVTLVLVLELLQAPRILLASIYAGVLSGAIGSVMNLLEKVSLHVGVSSGIGFVIFTLDSMLGMIAAVIVAIIAGARYKMKHHTVRELATGALIATSSIAVVFVFFGIL